jgi:hypothetical protein
LGQTIVPGLVIHADTGELQRIDQWLEDRAVQETPQVHLLRHSVVEHEEHGVRPADLPRRPRTGSRPRATVPAIRSYSRGAIVDKGRVRSWPVPSSSRAPPAASATSPERAVTLAAGACRATSAVERHAARVPPLLAWKCGGLVRVEVHADDDAVERADLRHVPKTGEPSIGLRRDALERSDSKSEPRPSDSGARRGQHALHRHLRRADSRVLAAREEVSPRARRTSARSRRHRDGSTRRRGRASHGFVDLVVHATTRRGCQRPLRTAGR